MGIDPHLELKRGKRGSFWVLVGNSAFLWSGDGYLGKLLGFHKGCQVSFRVPKGNMGFLGKRCIVKGPHIVLRGKFRGFCGVVAGSLGFLSLHGDLGDPLVFPQGSQICFRTRGALRDSYPVAAGMNRASS